MLLILHEHPLNGMPDIEKCAKSLTERYNEMTIGSGYPMIHSGINEEYEGLNVSLEWSVTDDQSISPNSSGHNAGEHAIPAARLL